MEKTFLVNERLFPISAPGQERFLEQVLSNDLSIDQRAKQKHEAYIANARKKEQQKETPDYQYFEWEELNSYLRWENVSSANYDDIKIMLRDKGISQEQLAEFEHRRWLRCHYLDNWEYSSQSDNRMHYHSDLKEFNDLSEEEKEKDRNITVKLSE